MQRGNRKLHRDIQLLARFVAIYCRSAHPHKEKQPLRVNGKVKAYLHGMALPLCPGCSKTLIHGVSKRLQCPYDPKPRCKVCPTHCYHPAYRSSMKEVMRVAGKKLLLRGRFDYLYHYFF